MTKQSYFWATPSGPIRLIEGDKMPVKPDFIALKKDQLYQDYKFFTGFKDADVLHQYEAALQAAKASSVPIQDQVKFLKAVGLTGDLQPDTIYGPFTVEYRIEDACAHDSCPVDGMCEHCKEPVKVAILLPENETQEDQEALLDELVTDIFEIGKEAILEKFTITRKQ